jgi:DNA-directed RNA polymerase subunit RPC12/RpoP
MEYLREICSGCGTLQLIINKRYCLCNDCNFRRLHGGKGKQEVYKERHDKKDKKQYASIKKTPWNTPDKGDLVNELKKVFSIKKISPKRAKRHSDLKEVYKKIDQEREPVCEGCGRGDVALSHSHLLSEYDRPDLYTDQDNIRLHCFGFYTSCHDKWERGLIHEVVLMLDFKENLDYIKSVDTKAYNKVIANATFHKIKL